MDTGDVNIEVRGTGAGLAFGTPGFTRAAPFGAMLVKLLEPLGLGFLHCHLKRSDSWVLKPEVGSSVFLRTAPRLCFIKVHSPPSPGSPLYVSIPHGVVISSEKFRSGH